MISRNQLDCLFIFPPGGENADNYFFYHTGSAYIISYLRLNGFTAEQFICNDLVSLDNCVRKILLLNARVIGFTVFNTNFLTSVLIAERLKKLSPGTIIAFGGPTASTFTEYILGKYSCIDVCFRHEGEESFLQFINQLSGNNKDFSSIDLGQIFGISYRIGDKIYNNPESNILVSNSSNADYLDKYPSPYLNEVVPGPAALTIGMITARGCNQNCIYCNCAVLSKRRFLTHSVDRVVSDVDFISRYSSGDKVLNFFDDAFTLIPQRAKRICKAIIDNRINISLSCITRCDCVDEELLDLMKEAGFVSLGFSLESANPKALRIIGKVHKAEDSPTDDLIQEGLFIEKLETATAYAKKIGIKNIFTSIMVGLPYETIEEANRTIETVDKNADIDLYTHNFLTVYHGTPLYSKYQKYGYKIEFFDDNPIFSRTIYPNEIVKEVKISSKSQIYRAQKIKYNDALNILSFAAEKNNEFGSFKNVILLSDIVDRQFVEWLKSVMVINGTIVQIYSDKNTMLGLSMDNYEKFIRYSSPSLNIQNYCMERGYDRLNLYSYPSSLLNLENKEAGISICDFSFIKANMANPEIDFTKMLCRESDNNDAISAYDYFYEVEKEKNLFGYLINHRAFPYFANLCKWRKDHSNCHKWNTIIVNKNSEVRLCWYGTIIGMVGQSFTELFDRFEALQIKLSGSRSCRECAANDYCIKCTSPFPVSDNDYCTKQKSKNLSEVTGLFGSFDFIKQYI
jgi:radical SAM superfamily enzyme YgiQ (UPF0313 family)